MANPSTTAETGPKGARNTQEVKFQDAWSSLTAMQRKMLVVMSHAVSADGNFHREPNVPQSDIELFLRLGLLELQGKEKRLTMAETVRLKCRLAEEQELTRYEADVQPPVHDTDPHR